MRGREKRSLRELHYGELNDLNRIRKPKMMGLVRNIACMGNKLVHVSRKT
jgi:hypothetical protein